MEQILAFCRPGFEAEAGRELVDSAMSVGLYGYFQPEKDRGLVRFSLPGPEPAEAMLERVALETLVFVRDWLIVLGTCTLPGEDRVGAVIEALKGHDSQLPRCARVEVRLLENNSDRDLGNFARKWVAPLSRGLRGAGLLDEADAEAPARLEIVFLPTRSLASVSAQTVPATSVVSRDFGCRPRRRVDRP